MPDARWMTVAQVAEHLGVTERVVHRMTEEGRLPAPSTFISPRQPRWDRLEVDSKMVGRAALSNVEQIGQQLVHDILSGHKNPYRPPRSGA